MEENRELTVREFFAALAEGYQLPRAPWADEESADDFDADEE